MALAVGGRPKADVLLHGDDLANRSFFGGPQFLGRKVAGVVSGPGLEQGRRPEQAPDMVGPKRRRIHQEHHRPPYRYGAAVSDDDLRRRAAGWPVARLATIGADGRPHLVPCCFAFSGDVAYSVVDHKPKRSAALRRLDNIRANPSVCLLVDHYADDWSTLWWVRFDGGARLLLDGPEHEQAVALLQTKYPQYRVTPPSGTVVAIDVTAVRSWSAEGR